jgi:hypothetical protein
MVEFVKARDGRCRFPGCAISARFCDIDHVVPWPVGATDPTNLVCLCRRHHRIKQRPRWRSRLDPDGSLVWTDPTDRQRTTLPLDQLQREQRTIRTLAPRIEIEGAIPSLSSVVDAGLPSVLEENFEHLTDRHLVDLACRPANLTTRNRHGHRPSLRRPAGPCRDDPPPF